MKLYVSLHGLSKTNVLDMEYCLGPCADDEYIKDPREVVRKFHRRSINHITIEVNVPEGLTAIEIAEGIENFAFQLHEDKQAKAATA